MIRKSAKPKLLQLLDYRRDLPKNPLWGRMVGPLAFYAALFILALNFICFLIWPLATPFEVYLYRRLLVYALVYMLPLSILFTRDSELINECPIHRFPLGLSLLGLIAGVPLALFALAFNYLLLSIFLNIFQLSDPHQNSMFVLQFLQRPLLGQFRDIPVFFISVIIVFETFLSEFWTKAVLQNGLLYRYSALKAMLLTALFSAGLAQTFAHWSAFFLLALVAAWWRLETRSIWSTILFVLSFQLAYAQLFPRLTLLAPYYQFQKILPALNDSLPLFILGLSALCLLFLLYYLARASLKALNPEHKSEEILQLNRKRKGQINVLFYFALVLLLATMLIS